MSEPIEFFFDFVSPYGYIASERIEAIAAKAGERSSGAPSCSARSSRSPAASR